MIIGIFETEHFEAAYPLIRLFDIPENKLVIFTNEYTYQPLKDLLRQSADRYTWVIKDEKQSLLAFLALTRKEILRQRVNFFYCNTISSNHLLFAILFKTLPNIRIVLTIHDINCLFRSAPGYGFKSIIRHIGKKALIKEVKEFNVISETLLPLSRQYAGKRKIVHNIPGGIFEFRKNKNSLVAPIRIIIPGTIDKKRRDYNQAFDLLHIAEKKRLSLEITLLGGAYEQYGRDILKKAREYSGIYTRVIFYEAEMVEQNEFNCRLDQAHFIFIPSVINTAICGNIPEIYGVTKSSGNIFDAVKHAAPLIAPGGLQIPDNLKNSCYQYRNTEQIASFLQTFVDDPEKYEEWESKAIESSKHYSIGNVKKRNPLLFS